MSIINIIHGIRFHCRFQEAVWTFHEADKFCSKNAWLLCKSTISHLVVLVLGLLCQKYGVKYCGFIPQPWALAFMPQITFLESHTRWMNTTISSGIYSSENGMFVLLTKFPCNLIVGEKLQCRIGLTGYTLLFEENTCLIRPHMLLLQAGLVVDLRVVEIAEIVQNFRYRVYCWVLEVYEESPHNEMESFCVYPRFHIMPIVWNVG